MQGGTEHLGPLDPQVDATILDAGDGGLRDAAQGRELRLAQACSSRMIRTDSPGVTSIRFFAGMGLLISALPVVMRRDTYHLYDHDVSLHEVDDSPLLVDELSAN